MTNSADVVKLANTLGLGPSAARLVGSTPTVRTSKEIISLGDQIVRNFAAVFPVQTIFIKSKTPPFI